MKKTIIPILLLIMAATGASAQIKDIMTVTFTDGTSVKYDAEEVKSCDFISEETPEIIPPVPGDYFYSDGTWSTYIEENKTIIGIVFWTGDPTKDDDKMRAEHPECTHGLVMALTQMESPWQAKYDTYSSSGRVSDWLTAHGYPTALSETDDNAIINKTVGYSYTSYIEAFNADEANAQWPVDAVNEVVRYRSTVPAPANTSGWYLGSPLELVYACFGEITGNVYTMGRHDPTMRDLLNSKFLNIANAQTTLDEDGDGYSFWTPMESSNYYGSAYTVYFNRNKVPVSGSVKDWSEYARVRPILAF